MLSEQALASKTRPSSVNQSVSHSVRNFIQVMSTYCHDEPLSFTHGHDQLYTWVTVDLHVITKQIRTVQSSGFRYITILKDTAILC
jgi:hypothetical protein